MLRDDIRPYIEDLKARKTTNRAVAQVLHVSEEQVSRVLKQLRVVKDSVPQAKKRRELAKIRREVRETAANSLPIKQAAVEANCSTRTIYRYKR